ncbi:hypothetical protein ACMBCM_08895, partial [Spiroplasma sp. K1]
LWDPSNRGYITTVRIEHTRNSIDVNGLEKDIYTCIHIYIYICIYILRVWEYFILLSPILALKLTQQNNHHRNTK